MRQRAFPRNHEKTAKSVKGTKNAILHLGTVGRPGSTTGRAGHNLEESLVNPSQSRILHVFFTSYGLKTS
ncbi:MAG: hypothetical protein CMJ81_06415 [Planctomycetaceae bacterium]|nr:hypothetical protein [Planctomycetaceae bacterium]